MPKIFSTMKKVVTNFESQRDKKVFAPLLELLPKNLEQEMRIVVPFEILFGNNGNTTGSLGSDEIMILEDDESIGAITSKLLKEYEDKNNCYVSFEESSNKTFLIVSPCEEY